jgi:PAS domain S-box-containing protein
MEITPVRYVRLLATLMVLAIVASVSLLLWSLRERELSHAHLETISLTQMLMDQTEKNFASIDILLQGIQERLLTPFGAQQALDSDSVRLLLNSRVSGLKQLRSIYMVDAKGQLVNSSREIPATAISVADREYFKVFAQGRPDFMFMDKPFRSRLDNGWTLTMARKIRGRDGSFRGVVVAAIGIEDFERSYSTVQLDYARPVGIYMTDGTLVASLPHRDNAIGQLAPELRNDNLPTKSKQIRVLNQRNAQTGKEVVAVGKLASFPLLISVTDIESQSLESWRDTAIPIASGTLLVSLFTALVAAYLVSKLRNKEQLSVALSAAHARYQQTVNSVMDAIVAVDESMRIIMFNPSAETMFGLSAEQALGQPLEILIPLRLRGAHGGHMRGFSASGTASRAMAAQNEIFGLRSDGVEFPLESTISHSMIGGKMQLTAVLRDVSERRRAENELRLLNSQLRELSASLESVREEERKRISRELHDDLGQQLTGLKLSLSWLGTRIKEGRDTAARNIDEMRHQLDSVIGSVRRIAAEMRPRLLDDLDFSEALTWQTQEFVKHSGLQVELDLSAAPLLHDDKVSTALFRIVQEALTNVVRHAQALRVRVAMQLEGDNLVLSIHDDGLGFDVAERQNGIGLVSMRERCVAIGAGFAVESGPGQGTTIFVRVPCASFAAVSEEGSA